jgi:hypothetical protein
LSLCRGPCVVVRTALVCVLLAVGCHGEQALAAGEAPEKPETQLADEVTDGPSPTRADAIVIMSARSRCISHRDFVAEFMWRLDDEALRDRHQKLEISVLRQDFQDAPQVFRADVEPGAVTYSFRGPLASVTVYYWRVRVLDPDGRDEVVSEVASFSTPSCAGADSPGG